MSPFGSLEILSALNRDYKSEYLDMEQLEEDY